LNDYQPSLLGSRISKTGNILRKTALDQIDDYQLKFSKVTDFYNYLFKDLIVDKYDFTNAYYTAKNFFDKDILHFVAVDGSEYSKPLFDLVIFYAGAYSCDGSIEFSEQYKDKLKINYQNRFIDHSLDISSCIPVYIDKIPEIDHTFHDKDGKVNLMKPITEETIINNTNIANLLMTFSEFYLSYKYASTKKYDIILMDRSLSNMYSSLLYDTSNRKTWDTNSSILNYKIDDMPIDVNDIIIARHNIIHDKLNLPSPRGDYLRYAIVNLLSRANQELDITRIILLLKVNNEEKIRKRIERYVQSSIDEGIFEEVKKGKYKIVERYRFSWSRIKRLVTIIGEKIFGENKEHFILDNEFGTKKWLTTLDLSFLTLFTLYMLIEECWKNKIILIGITKDTAAQEFKNHVIPICLMNNIWTNHNIIYDNLNKIPNTDRMLLQVMSMLNSDKINVPWGLVEYDSSFVMAIPDFKKRRGYVSGAIKNKIIQSQLFLRSFVQLASSRQDEKLRSNVLAIDRLVYPEFDLDQNENRIEMKHEYGSTEKVKFLLFRNNKIKNDLQNLLLIILKSMSHSNIGETFGYNRPLFVADKIAKWHNQEFRKIVDSTSHLITCNKNLKNFVYYMNTFREKRQGFESNRR
jgi:NurA domain